MISAAKGFRPAGATLGVLESTSSIRELAASSVGRHHRGRRAQWFDVRGLPGQGGPPGPGARGAAACRGRLHAPRGLAGDADLALRLPGRIAPPDGDPRAGDGRARVPLDAGDGRAVRALCGRDEHPALGRRPALRGGDRAVRSRRSDGLAGIQRREAPAAGRAAARRGRRPLDRPGTVTRRDRVPAAGDAEALRVLFDWSMVEYVEHFLDDERLQSAYLGQGVIGTFASPHDPGTASIHFHHQSGRLGGMPGMWGYVEGGMGMVSFILCDIAREAGAVVSDRDSRWRGSSRAPASSWRAANGSSRRASCRTPTRGRRSDCWARRPRRPGVPGSRRSRRSGVPSS